MCGCGPKNWGADGCAAHYENVCNVRAGADEKTAHTKGLHATLLKFALSFFGTQSETVKTFFISKYGKAHNTCVICSTWDT